MTLLDVVIFLPLVAFLIILVLPKENEDGIRTLQPGRVRWPFSWFRSA